LWSAHWLLGECAQIAFSRLIPYIAQQTVGNYPHSTQHAQAPPSGLLFGYPKLGSILDSGNLKVKTIRLGEKQQSASLSKLSSAAQLPIQSRPQSSLGVTLAVINPQPVDPAWTLHRQVSIHLVFDTRHILRVSFFQQSSKSRATVLEASTAFGLSSLQGSALTLPPHMN
jgi:hypothetical protein